MVEFLTTSGIYQLHKNVNYELEGHVFQQGDLKVRVGSLSVSYPKFLIVQVVYEPSVFYKGDREQNNYQSQIDELIRYSLRISQTELVRMRMERQGNDANNRQLG